MPSVPSLSDIQSDIASELEVKDKPKRNFKKHRREMERRIRVQTIDEFERLVGVESRVHGAQHYDLTFNLSEDSGDFVTAVVGRTPEGELGHNRQVVFTTRKS